MAVKDTSAMIAGMSPKLRPGRWVFCCTQDLKTVTATTPDAMALIREDEGITLVLPADVATTHGFEASAVFRQITLTVFSDLEGVGLTAAVSQALADADIPCNMVAAFHHDHVFVPEDQVNEALAVLQETQRLASG